MASFLVNNPFWNDPTYQTSGMEEAENSLKKEAKIKVGSYIAVFLQHSAIKHSFEDFQRESLIQYLKCS